LLLVSSAHSFLLCPCAPCDNGCAAAAPDRARHRDSARRHRCERGVHVGETRRSLSGAARACAHRRLSSTACPDGPRVPIRGWSLSSSCHGCVVASLTISALGLHAGRKLKGCVGGLCPILNTMHGLDPHAPSAPKRTAPNPPPTAAQPHPPKLTRKCRKLTCSALSLSARIAAHRRGLASGLVDRLHCEKVYMQPC